MSSDVPDRHDDGLSPFVEGGSEVVGATVGSVIGLLAGPLGIVAGAAGGVIVTRAMKRVGKELQERVLGPRQQARLATAATVAAEEIRARLDRGEQPRADWVGTDADAASPDVAEELLEGVLLVAANAYEERKVEYLGSLYASLAFDPTVGRGYANFLLRLADRLTYRDLVALALLSSAPNREALDEARSEGDGSPSNPITAELTEMGQIGVIGITQDDGSVAPPYAVYDGGTITSFPFAKIAPTTVGADLHRLMRLDRIPVDDLADVFAEMGGSRARFAR